MQCTLTLYRLSVVSTRLVSLVSLSETRQTICSYAAYRWNTFVSAIGAKYPHLQFLATTFPSTALNPPYTRSKYISPNTALQLTCSSRLSYV